MEVGVRILGVILRALNLILGPFWWAIGLGRHRPLSEVTNPLLLDSVVTLAKKIRCGEVTCARVMQAYVVRATEVNELLNAVVEYRYRDAFQEAADADRLLEKARRDGTLEHLVRQYPLLGVPFTVKASCSLQGLSNSVGCREFAGRRATVDGAAVQRIREAGAIPLLVSNTPELCLGWETSNLLHGTTNNPYDLARTPGGSSGGEAALVACCASPLSVASDIAGSIRVPSAFCGVFGHKPTPGIVPIEGHIPTLKDPNYRKFLTMGPIVRHAEDLLPVLQLMAGDSAIGLRLTEPVDITTVKVYYMTEATKSWALLNVDKIIKTMLERAVEYLTKQAGAQLSEDKFIDLEDSVEMSVSIFFSMTDIPNLMQDPNNSKKDKSLVIEFLKFLVGRSSRSLQALGFALIDRTNLFIPKSRRSYYEAKAKKLGEMMQRTLGDNGVFLYPAFNGLAHHHNQVFLRASGVMYTMLFNILGMPATCVPLGLHKGLPVGIQVIAAPNQDRLCLAVARELETAFGGWTPPPSKRTVLF